MRIRQNSRPDPHSVMFYHRFGVVNNKVVEKPKLADLIFHSSGNCGRGSHVQFYLLKNKA
ncbi:hypothetical protein [Virgibacillus sp. L01]|uniref:hypothetical protein n=1 Tax=Virgibacillus sp. L01 TaxID=3457429 RepID=UPI003FD290AB